MFVQTDNTVRQPGRRLSPRAGRRAQPRRAATPPAALGGILAGSVVDHLASQGSLSYDPRHALLYAVNAGSDTISVFAVQR